uniref:tRNA(Phe) (4-demethylwyosine(37)-C(7)) aminocarboxypropyltransferase n=1 Tax=Rhizochromulina marina TaxID=1034831 RepID=A0A7S2SKC6_9STRA
MASPPMAPLSEELQVGHSREDGPQSGGHPLPANDAQSSRDTARRSKRMKKSPVERRGSEEVIVDLYAGIGYYTLPFLVHHGAKHVHACEWNDDSVVALRHNLQANKISPDRCTVHHGDNRQTAPNLENVAHRVNLGLLPSSEEGWPLAIRALRSDGGWMHVHENVKDSEVERWTAMLCRRLEELARERGASWKATCTHTERVKSYAPHILHVVVDVFLQ